MARWREYASKPSTFRFEFRKNLHPVSLKPHKELAGYAANSGGITGFHP
jgi:hypothetical protein